MIHWKDDGIHYEADSRHAEIVVNGLGLNQYSVGLSTPGTKEGAQDDDDEASEVSSHSLYRAMSARCNCLAQDRSDIQSSVKEVARGMSASTKGYLRKLKRLARYLKV